MCSCTIQVRMIRILYMLDIHAIFIIRIFLISNCSIMDAEGQDLKRGGKHLKWWLRLCFISQHLKLACLVWIPAITVLLQFPVIAHRRRQQKWLKSSGSWYTWGRSRLSSRILALAWPKTAAAAVYGVKQQMKFASVEVEARWRYSSGMFQVTQGKMDN